MALKASGPGRRPARATGPADPGPNWARASAGTMVAATLLTSAEQRWGRARAESDGARGGADRRLCKSIAARWQIGRINRRHGMARTLISEEDTGSTRNRSKVLRRPAYKSVRPVYKK